MTVSGIAERFAVSAIRKNPASPAMGTEEILNGIEGKMVFAKNKENSELFPRIGRTRRHRAREITRMGKLLASQTVINNCLVPAFVSMFSIVRGFRGRVVPGEVSGSGTV